MKSIIKTRSLGIILTFLLVLGFIGLVQAEDLQPDKFNTIQEKSEASSLEEEAVKLIKKNDDALLTNKGVEPLGVSLLESSESPSGDSGPIDEPLTNPGGDGDDDPQDPDDSTPPPDGGPMETRGIDGGDTVTGVTGVEGPKITKDKGNSEE